jgi:DNA-binding NarL/FixJ family response regulator
MFRKRRSVREGAPSNGEAELPAARPPLPPPPLRTNVILVGAPGETRDWLESLIVGRPDVHLVGIHSRPEQASSALKESAGKKAGAVLVDATLPEMDGNRSAIRMMRERFPTLRVVAYGRGLDEASIDGLYFVGADAVVLADMDGDEVVTVILGLASRPVDAGWPTNRAPATQPPDEAPVPHAILVERQEPAPMVAEVEVAAEESHTQSIQESPNKAKWTSFRGIWGDQTSEVEEPATASSPEQAPPRPKKQAQGIWRNQIPAKEEPQPAGRWTIRGLGLHRSTAEHQGGSQQSTPDQYRVGDDQHQAITRNLRRLVPPWQPKDGKPREGEEAGPDEEAKDQPEEP